MQSPLQFSLVLGTVGRTDELGRMLDSLCRQTHRNFEVILVDQNPGPELDDLRNVYESRIALRHVRARRGLSRARNAGLRFAGGDIIGFPDDDCWYEPDLLQRVAAELERNPKWSAVTGRAIMPTGEPSSGRWDRSAGPVSRVNVWRRAISFSMFFRRHAIQRCRFDESLGVGAGTPWGAGEETDFLLQVLAQGGQIHYDPTLTVFHPEWGKGPYTPAIRTKARSYGRGIGRVLRKHNYPLAQVGYHLLRPLGGSVLSLAAWRPDKARYHWAIFAGRTSGWLSSDPPEPECGSVPSEEDPLAG